MDAATGEQLAFKNVFVLFAGVGHKPEPQLTDFDLSSGSGYYFTGGSYAPVTWSKDGDQAPLKLYDAGGGELSVAAGKSYIAVVSSARADSLTVDGAALNAAPTASPAA